MDMQGARNVVGGVEPHTQKHYELWRFYHPGGAKCYEPWRCARDHVALLAWTEDVPNIVTTVGKNKLINSNFKDGLAAPAWYEGLVDDDGFTAYAVGDTMASHSGWVEAVGYSNSTRQAFTPGTIAAGAVSNAGSVAAFNINLEARIRGSFLVDVATKGGSLGVLYGAADFVVGRDVLPGDILTVLSTVSVT